MIARPAGQIKTQDPRTVKGFNNSQAPLPPLKLRWLKSLIGRADLTHLEFHVLVLVASVARDSDLTGARVPSYSELTRWVYGADGIGDRPDRYHVSEVLESLVDKGYLIPNGRHGNAHIFDVNTEDLGPPTGPVAPKFGAFMRSLRHEPLPHSLFRLRLIMATYSDQTTLGGICPKPATMFKAACLARRTGYTALAALTAGQFVVEVEPSKWISGDGGRNSRKRPGTYQIRCKTR